MYEWAAPIWHDLITAVQDDLAIRRPNSSTSVVSFVEKPEADRAARLRKPGALWNMFVIAGSVRALLELYDSEHGASVDIMRIPNLTLQCKHAVGALFSATPSGEATTLAPPH